MSLEDIESRLGPLFEAEVMANLKSANWKERLEGEERAQCLRLSGV
jgi:hypothetical protein